MCLWSLLLQAVRYLQKHIVKPLVSGREYCVSVCFWDSLEPKESNYSQPVCASTPGIISAGTFFHFNLLVSDIMGSHIKAI